MKGFQYIYVRKVRRHLNSMEYKDSRDMRYSRTMMIDDVVIKRAFVGIVQFSCNAWEASVFFNKGNQKRFSVIL